MLLLGAGKNGQFEELDFIGTPWGDLGAQNTATLGAANDQDFRASAFPGSQAGGGDTLFRLREGVERFLVTDINNPGGSAQAQSHVPVMWDHITTAENDVPHKPGSCNALYMDGHDVFVKYPAEQFPLTAASARTFARYNRVFDGF